MITIEGIATILPDGTITVQAETALDLPPGEHRIVMVIEQSLADAQLVPKKKSILDVPVIHVGSWPDNLSLRREDMYGDDGR